jgi:hypothetical protein
MYSVLNATGGYLYQTRQDPSNDVLSLMGSYTILECCRNACVVQLSNTLWLLAV